MCAASRCMTFIPGESLAFTFTFKVVDVGGHARDTRAVVVPTLGGAVFVPGAWFGGARLPGAAGVSRAVRTSY